MPDFNKGDFTQQGVNGHVNATVRLNEKRLVNIDMTSNEEAEGCTIAGTVKDLFNDKVYPIGAGVSGNIEITENGENINVAPYATATVNVAGGGVELRKGTITIVNNSPNSQSTLDFINGLMSIDNGCAYQDFNTGETVEPNTTVVIEGIIIKVVQVPVGGSPITDYLLCGYNMLGTLSNLSNCYLADSGDFEGYILVTDPTEDCSLTITLYDNVLG